MTALAPDRKADTPKDPAVSQNVGSPRERLQRSRPLRHKDVDVPGLGRFRVREIRQSEKDEADAPVVRAEGDGMGNMTQHFDSRGHRSRLIAFCLINDDGSNVYRDPMGEGATEIGALPRDAHEALWRAYDELNPTSDEAKATLGKGSAKATS